MSNLKEEERLIDSLHSQDYCRVAGGYYVSTYIPTVCPQGTPSVLITIDRIHNLVHIYLPKLSRWITGPIDEWEDLLKEANEESKSQEEFDKEFNSQFDIGPNFSPTPNFCGDCKKAIISLKDKYCESCSNKRKRLKVYEKV